jgi:AbrB family looped-hinge helix DNA binding protein
MRITEKGQVTIPQAIRERAGLMPGTDVDFLIDPNGGVRLVKAERSGKRRTRGEKLVEALREKGKGWGRGVFDGMTTDEIIRLMRGPPADEDAPPPT